MPRHALDAPRTSKALECSGSVANGAARRRYCYKLWSTEQPATMQDFKSRSLGRSACVAFIAFCEACNALLDNHSRDLVVSGAGGTASASGVAGNGGSGGTESAGEAGMSGASGDSNQGSEGGAAGSENEPAGNPGGSPSGGSAGRNQGGASQGGMPACTGCTPGVTEAQTRACGICNAGKESGTRVCSPSCTWQTTWSGACSDHGTSENGCSVVKWCKNDAGRPECSLLGCTAKTAEDECRKEAQTICGTVSNLVINTSCP